MPNYTKLFNSIVTSTIWTEDDKTRIVWITMLALADQNGEVHASIPGLARLAGVSVESVKDAIGKFLGPDEYSRTPDNEGRRIAPIDGGWELLNHAKYRKMASLADQKDATAKRQQRFRDRNAPVTDSNATVTLRNAPVTVKPYKAEAEAEAEAEADTKENKTPNAPDGASPDPKLAAVSWSAENGFSGITEKDLAEWSAAYPAVSLQMQLARAHTWLVDNPAKRKKHIRRFISGWFSRAQERGGDIPANKPSAPPLKKLPWEP